MNNDQIRETLHQIEAALERADSIETHQAYLGRKLAKAVLTAEDSDDEAVIKVICREVLGSESEADQNNAKLETLRDQLRDSQKQ